MYKKLIRDRDEHNKAIEENITKFLTENPIEGAHKRIEFSDIHIERPPENFDNIKDAIINRKTIGSKLYATATVVSKRTGKVEDRKKIYLGKIPYKNQLGTYIIEGNHYVIPHQFRLKPSGYTMLKKDGSIETLFNTAGGHSIRTVIPHSKNDFWFQVGSRKFNAYDLLRIMGASDEEIKKRLGPELYALAKQKSDLDKTAISLAEVTKAVDPKKATTSEGLKLLRESLESGKLDPEATHRTLHISADHINKDVLMNSIIKGILVKRGEEEPDDKENLIFKKVITPEDLITEGIKRELKTSLWKKKAPLNSFMPIKAEEVINEPLVGEAAKKFVSTSAISRMPEGYNPLQLKQINADITPLGEGGIKSAEVITPSMRSVHPSQLGFIDPIKSPEGANTGITLSLTENSFIDENNNPAMIVKNLKTGKLEIKPLKELWDKKIAFPDVGKDGKVGIRHKDKLYEDHISKADYQIPSSTLLYGPAMNSLGLLSANDPTRNLMASKHILQALPLKERDIPHVLIEDENGNIPLKEYAKEHLPVAPEDGKVLSIDPKKGEIKIQGKSGKVHIVHYASNITPLNAKTYLKHELHIKPGDVVKKGEVLGDSNYTKEGYFALGKNLRTAFMMFPGTRNDAFIVSESAAKKLTSLHTTKHSIDIDKNTEFNKKKFVTMFPEIAKKIDLDKYDENGFLKKGVKIHKGEPIFLGLRKMDEREIKFANEKVKKLLYGGYVPLMEEWKYSDPAELDSAGIKKNKATIIMKYESPLKVGDKVAGRSGNKGIISKIIPDDQMPRTEDGKPIEIIMGGAGVASRQNPAQIIEATLGAVSEKTGKRYTVPHHVDFDLAESAKKEAEKHGVKLYHRVYDPLRKKWIKQPVFIGNYHVQKLFKVGDSAYSAVGYGATDGLDQPKKGGKTSASSISNMEVNALLVHGAKNFLRETFKIRSQKNRDWFNAFMRGDTILPIPENKTSLEKFKALLQQMNMKVVDDGKHIKILPMTDKDVLKLSNGEVKEPYGLNQNTLKEIEKGFYDTKIFGGNGNYYGHIDLGEKIINPNYKELIARLMDTTPKKLDEEIEKGKIGDIEERLKKVNLDKVETEIKRNIKKTNDPTKINMLVRTLKGIKKLKETDTNLQDVAFISKIPVLPIKYRPVAKLPNGTLVDHDINHHYARIIEAANTLKQAKKELGSDHPLVGKLRTELQKHVGAMYGVNESPDPVMKKLEVKSVQEYIAGKKPKESFWQKNILQNRVFTSGRAVIIPKETYLSMDEVELPKEVAWKIFEPHIKRKLAQTGMSTMHIDEHIEKRTPLATQTLHQVMREVPVVINRAPSLHKFNMTGHFAKISPDNAMRISPLIEPGQNADYDGDQLAIHVPLTPEAIRDVKEKILASKQLFGARNNEQLMMKIDLDPYIGFYHATKYRNKKPVR